MLMMATIAVAIVTTTFMMIAVVMVTMVIYNADYIVMILLMTIMMAEVGMENVGLKQPKNTHERTLGDSQHSPLSTTHDEE